MTNIIQTVKEALIANHNDPIVAVGLPVLLATIAVLGTVELIGFIKKHFGPPTNK